MIATRLGFMWLLLVAMGCGWGDPREQIALGDPIESAGIRGLGALADGRRAMTGAPWNASSAAVFEDDAFVVFDLGEVTAIDAVYVQGDNNDRFIIETSVDGDHYSKLWTAPAVGGEGLRARWRKDLGGSGRFVRVSADGGDRWVSLSEIQLFTAAPSIWPPLVAVDIEMTQSLWARLTLLLFTVFALAAAAFHRSGSKRSVVLWTLVGASALAAAYALVATWPADTAFINLSRAVAAIVASAVVLRLGFWPDRAQSRASTALLTAMAALSVLAFYNFGHP
ncbi:MAG: hypothetical protein JRE81_07750, partial [Deltaproteobacteria bacterium]|nr:hypothetical protein [Deltaproteobacteria bacterium]